MHNITKDTTEITDIITEHHKLSICKSKSFAINEMYD